MSITYKEFNKQEKSPEEKIVDLLKERPMYVQEIAEKLKLIQPQTSVLLKKMVSKGVLSMKSVKQRNYYGLSK